MMTRAEVRQSYKLRLTDERNAAQRILAQDGADAESGGAEVYAHYDRGVAEGVRQLRQEC